MTNREPSFNEAIEIAHVWCREWDEGSLSDEVFADRIGELIKTNDGMRGFFVLSLTSDFTVIDRLSDPLIFQLRKNGEPVVALTVKNLAMSSAMSIKHHLEKNFSQELSSERITARCTEILRNLDSVLVKKELEKILEGLDGNGELAKFIKRWEYDKIQKENIRKNIYSVAE